MTVRRYRAKREEVVLTKSMDLLVCVRQGIQGWLVRLVRIRQMQNGELCNTVKF